MNAQKDAVSRVRLASPRADETLVRRVATRMQLLVGFKAFLFLSKDAETSPSSTEAQCVTVRVDAHERSEGEAHAQEHHGHG